MLINKDLLKKNINNLDLVKIKFYTVKIFFIYIVRFTKNDKLAFAQTCHFLAFNSLHKLRKNFQSPKILFLEKSRTE